MKQIVISDMKCRSICVVFTRCSTRSYDYQHLDLLVKILFKIQILVLLVKIQIVVLLVKIQILDLLVKMQILV